MNTTTSLVSRTRAFCALIAVFLGAACAGYDVRPVDPTVLSTWGQGSPKEGYIVYEPDPYLRVIRTVADGKLQVSADIVYLPNRNRPYRVSTYAYIATADIKLTYKDGWQLTNAESNVDTASVAKAVIDAVGEGISLFSNPPANTSTKVAFYSLTFTDGTVTGCKEAFAVPL